MNFNGFGAIVKFFVNVHTYTSRRSALIGYKQSLNNARSIAFSQRTGSTHLIEDEIFNDSDIINNLIYYENGHKEIDSSRDDTTDHQIKTSVHAPQRPMVTCIMMGTVVPGPHGLLCF
ncbi:uncharacterized protein TNCV_709591 [Trichonephila clavipes]|nr:uncharacterized protein TNCV_709591 [Trichonephila clavipes]